MTSPTLNIGWNKYEVVLLVDAYQRYLQEEWSRKDAEATDKQVEYTLKKGFNDAECQEWILKALNDHKVLSRKQINELLWNKLPIDFTEDQKMAKIKNLLYKMHKNNTIYLDENRNWRLRRV